MMEDKVEIKRTLNTFGAMSTIVGCMIGSGIFISVEGVLLYTGSLGLNFILWIACGLIALGGALCYAELATLVQESGGTWAYIYRGLGAPLAFTAAWCNQILTPVSNIVITMSSSEYLLSNFFICKVPILITRLCSLVIFWICLYINCSVKLTTKVLKVLLVMKILALSMIIVGGVYWMVTQGVDNLAGGFKDTTKDPWKVALAFYSGLWAYDGWEIANYVTEEVKNVKKTMPRAIIGSVVLVISFYLLVNVSYYSVLTTPEVISSSTVAADWGYKLVGKWSSLFSVIVALSMIGSVIATLFGTSRILMAVAREGHTLQILAMVNVKDNSPLSSVFLRGLIAPVIVFIGDISSLINFFSFSVWLFYALAFISLIKLKLTGYRSDETDLFRVPIVLPFIMLLVAGYLVVMPIVADPKLEFLYAALVIAAGLIFYFPFVYFKAESEWFDKVTVFFQLLLKVSLPNKDI